MSSFLNLNSTRFDCSFIVASNTFPDCMSFLKIVKDLFKKIPILGVCLGHQIIGQVFGANIVNARKLMHGKTSKILHNKTGIFKGVKNNLVGTRYHLSLIHI